MYTILFNFQIELVMFPVEYKATQGQIYSHKSSFNTYTVIN